MMTRSCAPSRSSGPATCDENAHRKFLELKRDASALVATHNRTGYISCYLDPVTDQFIRFAGEKKGVCLEIGAGFGAASLAAVKAGARKAIVTDPQKSHLMAHLPYVDGSEKCILRVGSVPNGIALPKNSVDAVLLARVLHFLPGDQVQAAISSCGRWLTPGGRIFVVCDSIHSKQFGALLPQYKLRKRAGQIYPGYFNGMGKIHKERRNDLPGVFHYFECKTLGAYFRESQFRVMSLNYFGRTDYPLEKKKDGRECIGLIAEKI